MMSIARVDFARRFHESGIEGIIVNTVHDSVVLDVRKEIQATAILFHQVFNDLPANFERIFKVPWDLPMKCEVSVGPKYEGFNGNSGLKPLTHRALYRIIVVKLVIKETKGESKNDSSRNSIDS